MNSGQSFERRLLEGPTAALNHFRALWDNRASGIIQEKSELCDALKVLATHFERKSADASGRQSPLVRPGNDIWDAVVVAELPLLLENIMAENDFFLNCQVWIEGVMLCLAAIVHACHWACHDQPRRIPFPETMSRHFLREGSRNIWTSGWQNRERIVSIENRQHLPLLTRILAMFNIIYEYDAHKVAMKTCSPDLGRLALFVWFHTPRTALVKHRHAAFLTFSSIFIPMDFGKDQRYLKTVVSDSAVGAVPLMSNILATIGTDELLLDGELENFVSIIEALLSFYSEQRPQFFALPILHSLVLGMARQRRDGGSDWEAGIRVWGAIQRILRRIKQGLRDGICPVRLVNGQDVMEVLVQGAATVYALLLYSDKPQRDERAALVGVDGSEQLVGSGDGSVDEDEGESTDQEGGSDDHEGDTEDTDNENFGVQGVDYEGDYSGDEKDGNGHGADEEDSDGEVASEEDVDEEESDVGDEGIDEEDDTDTEPDESEEDGSDDEANAQDMDAQSTDDDVSDFGEIKEQGSCEEDDDDSPGEDAEEDEDEEDDEDDDAEEQDTDEKDIDEQIVPEDEGTDDDEYTEDDADSENDSEIYDSIWSSVKTWAPLIAQIVDEWSEDLRRTSAGLDHSLPVSLAMDMRAHCRERWYTIVAGFRDTRYTSAAQREYQAIIDAWIRLGGELGFEEIRERDRAELEKARQCSWEKCRYHESPSPKPLSVCKGCGDVRYCSKDCQRMDWKAGSHRTRCRRITT